MICPICKRRFGEGPGGRTGGPEGSVPGDAKEAARDGANGRPPTGPFCSARCRTVDLGNWLDGAYRIGGADEDDDHDDARRSGPRDGDDDDDAPSPSN